jgi:hypothetical protein
MRKSESVYFYTFHKCASTLFSSYILKCIEGLHHVDYASQIYSGKRIEQLVFRARGYVYGPIRLSADPMTPVYKTLVAPASELEFIRDKIAIFFVRDPRDILVSSYYSFGYTHGFSPVKEIRKRQEVIRNKIQASSLDEYVLASANAVSKNFETLGELNSVCERSAILKYEDMISNFECFIAQLFKYIVIDRSVVREIYERSRPKQKEDTSSNRRSGKVSGFRSKLKEETIEALNREIEDTLVRFHYEA